MTKKQIILLHAIFWAVTLITIGLTTIPSFGKTPMNYIVGDYLIYAVSFISLFYMFYFFISKKYLNKKRMTFLIIFGLIFTFAMTVPIALFYIYILFEQVFELERKKFLIEFGYYYLAILETNFLFVVSGSLLKIALLWYENTMSQKEIEKQCVSGELALLKSQINPKFLLNTLANIKSLIEPMPEKAIYSIENFSEIMSYMLYETSAEKVFLDEEIICINNYLNLQRVRYNPKFISFEVKGETTGKMVTPLLFIPFIENALKYGNNFSQTPGIVINLDISDNDLSFKVMNYVKESINQSRSEDGFSIKSIKRRLDLLYGDNYSLDIISESSKYIIRLNIKYSV